MGTSDLLEDFFDYVYENLDYTKYMLGVFIDFAGAFETINYSILLYLLYSLGIRGKVYDLLQNYILDRYQTVQLRSKYNSPIRVKQGLPHGTILGPIMFNLYVNEIAQLKQTRKLFQFADDTVAVYAHENYEVAVGEVQEHIHNIFQWYCEN